MSDTCNSEACNRPFVSGDRIVYMAKGRYQSAHSTPVVFQALLGEWHQRCFDEVPLQRQSMPFRCQVCTGPIRHGDEVVYASYATKADVGDPRPEPRENDVYWIIHSKCP